jgi:hypothetical protein
MKASKIAHISCARYKVKPMIAALLLFNSTHKKSIEIFYLLVVLDSEIATSK